MPVHLIVEYGAAEIWLDTEAKHCNGVCIGVGATIELAIADARDMLNGVFNELDQLDERDAATADLDEEEPV